MLGQEQQVSKWSMANSENKHGRSRHNYRLSHQTQISRNTYRPLSVFGRGVFRFCNIAWWSIVSFWVRSYKADTTRSLLPGKLMVTQCQWRISLLIIALPWPFFCEMSHSLVRPLPFAFQYIGGIYIHQGKGTSWKGKGVTSPQISIFIYHQLHALNPQNCTDKGNRLYFNINRA